MLWNFLRMFITRQSFVLGRPFQNSLLFVGKDLSGALLKGRLLPSLTHEHYIRAAREKHCILLHTFVNYRIKSFRIQGPERSVCLVCMSFKYSTAKNLSFFYRYHNSRKIVRTKKGFCPSRKKTGLDGKSKYVHTCDTLKPQLVLLKNAHAKLQLQV